MNVRAQFFQNLNLVLIKIGTKTLVSPTGKVYLKNFSVLAEQINWLKQQNYQVIIVSSGSVGIGMSRLQYNERPKELALKQACAAIGQGELIHLYSDAFATYNQKIAQVLLSAEDFKNRQRCTNIKKTLNTLLKQDIIPIINENDTLSTQEIKVGDNDKLASDVSIFLEVDLFILISDEKGFYTKNPKKYSDAKLLAVIPKITKEHIDLAKGAGSSQSIGGMRSKIKAIKQASQNNILVALINLKHKNLMKLFQGKPVGSLFLPQTKKVKSNKKWLGFISTAKGVITIDTGAQQALQTKQSSLLFAGVLSIKGSFKEKDFVKISSTKNESIGRGQVSYSSTQILAHLAKRKTTNKPSKLKPIVHRDYLVIY